PAEVRARRCARVRGLEDGLAESIVRRALPDLGFAGDHLRRDWFVDFAVVHFPESSGSRGLQRLTRDAYRALRSVSACARVGEWFFRRLGVCFGWCAAVANSDTGREWRRACAAPGRAAR